MQRKVLVVDDEPNIVLSLEFLMRECGHEVAVAHNGEDALRLAGSFRPDLVLLDVMMPALNGFEVCRRLRECPGPQAKVVMLTAKGRVPDQLKGAASGADAYVIKPFSTKELVSTVQQLLEADG